MDHRLVSAARAVKARQRRLGHRHPVLWLFTDRRVVPDPLAAIARLPPGLAGVVFRDDDAPDRAALGARLAQACRRRRVAFVVAGDARLARALGAGLHARRGAAARTLLRRGAWRTASAHDGRELRRARRGSDIVFLSPAFATESHPGAPALGPRRWAALARGAAPAVVLALGGITGQTAGRLGRICAGFAAIRALRCAR
jgi:thiamine-phosphate pyrophosphorylase